MVPRPEESELQIDVDAAASGDGGVCGSDVIRVVVSDPWCDHEVVRPNVLDEDVQKPFGVFREATVWEPKRHEIDIVSAQGRESCALFTPSKTTEFSVSLWSIRSVAVGHSDDDDRYVGTALMCDESARRESLVVRMWHEDDGSRRWWSPRAGRSMNAMPILGHRAIVTPTAFTVRDWFRRPGVGWATGH
jgi:hypothetical protein